MESVTDHRPLPFLKAIGIPATATYRGQEHKAFVFICGHKKGPGVIGPSVEIYIEDLRNVVPAEELNLFEGPDTTDAEEAVRSMSISIRRGKQLYRASNSVNLDIGEYPASIVQNDGSDNVFDASSPSKGPHLAAWKQLMSVASTGFEEGHIAFGGNAASSKIEIRFSGNGIEPLLKELINSVGL